MQFAHSVDEFVQVDGPGPQLARAAEAEQALGQGGAAMGGLRGVADEALHARLIDDLGRDQLQATEDRRQKIVEVVGDSTGKGSECLHLVGLAQAGLEQTSAR